MRFYIASKLENHQQVSQVANALKAAGHTHSYDWTVHGSVQGEGPARCREVAYREINGVATADVVIVLLPGGRGTHVELGMALARNIPVILCYGDKEQVLEDTCTFYWDDLCSHCCGSVDAWVAAALEFFNA